MAEVVVIRPGCTDYDEQHRVKGSLDLPLNGRGRDQVHRLADLVREIPLEVIYTSESNPARSTAEMLGTELGIPVRHNEELRNVDHGLWQGMCVDEIRRMYPKVCKQWREAPESICPPEGEPILEAVERLEKVLAKPLKRGKNFAIVVSEPLATLVGCIVTKGELELPALNEDEGEEVAEVLTIAANGNDRKPKSRIGATNGSGQSTEGRPE